jgi:hypothetical protein
MPYRRIPARTRAPIEDPRQCGPWARTAGNIGSELSGDATGLQCSTWGLTTVDERAHQLYRLGPICRGRLPVEIEHPHMSAGQSRASAGRYPGADMSTQASPDEPPRLPPHVDVGRVIEVAKHYPRRLELERHFGQQRLDSATATVVLDARDSARCGHFVVSHPFVSDP